MVLETFPNVADLDISDNPELGTLPGLSRLKGLRWLAAKNIGLKNFDNFPSQMDVNFLSLDLSENSFSYIGQLEPFGETPKPEDLPTIYRAAEKLASYNNLQYINLSKTQLGEVFFERFFEIKKSGSNGVAALKSFVATSGGRPYRGEPGNSTSERNYYYCSGIHFGAGQSKFPARPLDFNKIQSLGEMRKLRYVDVSGHLCLNHKNDTWFPGLQNLDLFKEMPNLERLIVNNNNIRRFDGLENFEAKDEVDIAGARAIVDDCRDTARDSAFCNQLTLAGEHKEIFLDAVNGSETHMITIWKTGDQPPSESEENTVIVGNSGSPNLFDADSPSTCNPTDKACEEVKKIEIIACAGGKGGNGGQGGQSGGMCSTWQDHWDHSYSCSKPPSKGEWGLLGQYDARQYSVVEGLNSSGISINTLLVADKLDTSIAAQEDSTFLDLGILGPKYPRTYVKKYSFPNKAIEDYYVYETTSYEYCKGGAGGIAGRSGPGSPYANQGGNGGAPANPGADGAGTLVERTTVDLTSRENSSLRYLKITPGVGGGGGSGGAAGPISCSEFWWDDGRIEYHHCKMQQENWHYRINSGGDATGGGPGAMGNSGYVLIRYQLLPSFQIPPIPDTARTSAAHQEKK